MKIVNETSKKVAGNPISTRFVDAGKGRVWLWDRATGKPKALYSVDATELLEKYPDKWSATSVSESQAQAEDAVVVESAPVATLEVEEAKLDDADIDAWPSKTDEDESGSRPTQSSNRSRSRKKASSKK